MSDAVGRYLAACNAFVGVTEQGGPNAGQMVELFQKAVSLQRGQPWCVAFVNYVGKHAFSVYDPKTTWPIPMYGGCAILGEWAAKHKILLKTGAPGDLFLLYYPSMKRLAHVGVLVEPVSGQDNAWVTIEGNTSGGGSREGWMVAKRVRVIDPAAGHRFVRWTTLMKE